MSASVTAPGDLGRRVARRRESLGLSRERLGERSGVDPGYIDYLEHHPASPSMSTVRHLAAALETTVHDLLGAEWERPPGRAVAARNAHLEELTPQECLRLISPGGVGRIAFPARDGTAIMPMNYVIYHRSVLLRSALHGPLDEDLRTGLDGVERVVAFEVDRIDEAQRTAWSVLVRGPAHHVTDPAELAAVAEAAAHPWAGGRRELYIRIPCVTLTGRRIRHD
ncbi:transcriptional regulator with XRE-family HTH domain [Thermocatellispora tengchongensis]|uniref:Transcriptional regulator with XRE-family HTH domain n=1 Tax=Thermocatellispora tengchongensis TaxID=1073253 RepID=A0A840P4J5_9ACTN|nr:pyridoxamine 5'-phosphate oxidase family protein [Thermocatellispora tengchongensis]MBB5134282.1 transcriptional regulator with XRE-family HTH domain [Thermocatellispora tengchongensis]